MVVARSLAGLCIVDNYLDFFINLGHVCNFRVGRPSIQCFEVQSLVSLIKTDTECVGF